MSDAEPVDQNGAGPREMFREAMSRLGAAVHIITTAGPAGRYGMTASAVCSVTDAPPTLLVCINRASAGNLALKENGVLCINLIAARHRALAGRFSTHDLTIEERFGDPSLWRSLATGAPALIDAGVALDCRISAVSEIGSHSVFFAEVEQITLGSHAECLVYFDRSFHPLTRAVDEDAIDDGH